MAMLITTIRSFHLNKINKVSHKLFSKSFNDESFNKFPSNSFTNNLNSGDINSVEKRKTIPLRNDICKVLVTGVVGTDTRENYLKNSHYVVSFSIAVMGHFKAVSEWEETNKNTTWISCEVWDEEAKKHVSKIQKGSSISGVGTLILNKWQDKTTGENRQNLKLRILKFVDTELLKNIIDENDLNFEESDDHNEFEDSSSNPFTSNSFDQLRVKYDQTSTKAKGYNDEIPF